METQSGVQRNIDRLAQIFPTCITETIESNGHLHKAVDFDRLHQLLSDDVDSSHESYEFSWPGKHAAILDANQRTRKTLRPRPDSSVMWDETDNIYIEGENLEVLKTLQESYMDRVKMIYIDPPYNTGKDFIYRDRFEQSKTQYDAETRSVDAETGDRLFRNADSSGRFHSAWCSMLYSRLMLSRNLLTDDGAIFISIDDNEQANLRKICDEVFGAANFITQIVWKKRSTPPNDKVIGAAHEYILVYAKDADTVSLNLRERTAEQLNRYSNPDNHPKGPWCAGDLSANVKGGRYVAALNYPIVNPNTLEEHFPPHGGNWRFSQDTMNKLLADNEITFGKNGRGRPKLKRFLCDVKGGMTYTSLWDFVPLNTQGSAEMTELLGNQSVFDNPKPVGLVVELLKLGLGKEDTVLDFFSGSATTAHAAMQLNAEDGGHRKFILVQSPEVCSKKSEAYKAGYGTICEIGEERIRRAASHIAAENPGKTFDGGFRVFMLDDTNMTDVYYSAKEYTQNLLSQLESNIKPDRTDLDLFFGCLLEWGMPLSMPCASEELYGCRVLSYNDGSLIACFEENIPETVIKAIARRKPEKAIFRNSSFVDSPSKINDGEIFKMISPDTKVKIL